MPHASFCARRRWRRSWACLSRPATRSTLSPRALHTRPHGHGVPRRGQVLPTSCGIARQHRLRQVVDGRDDSRARGPIAVGQSDRVRLARGIRRNSVTRGNFAFPVLMISIAGTGSTLPALLVDECRRAGGDVRRSHANSRPTTRLWCSNERSSRQNDFLEQQGQNGRAGGVHGG